MTHVIVVRWAAIVAAASLIAACSTTPPTRYYALEAVAPAQSTPAAPRTGQAGTAVAVRTVAVSSRTQAGAAGRPPPGGEKGRTNGASFRSSASRSTAT